MRLATCLTLCLMPIMANAAQTDAQARPTLKRIVLITAPTFIRIGVNPAKSGWAFNSDWAIAVKVLMAVACCAKGAVLSNGWQQSNYRLKTEFRPQNI